MELTTLFLLLAPLSHLVTANELVYGRLAKSAHVVGRADIQTLYGRINREIFHGVFEDGLQKRQLCGFGSTCTSACESCGSSYIWCGTETGGSCDCSDSTGSCSGGSGGNGGSGGGGGGGGDIICGSGTTCTSACSNCGSGYRWCGTMSDNACDCSNSSGSCSGSGGSGGNGGGGGGGGGDDEICGSGKTCSAACSACGSSVIWCGTRASDDTCECSDYSGSCSGSGGSGDTTSLSFSRSSTSTFFTDFESSSTSDFFTDFETSSTSTSDSFATEAETSTTSSTSTTRSLSTTTVISSPTAAGGNGESAASGRVEVAFGAVILGVVALGL